MFRLIAAPLVVALAVMARLPGLAWADKPIVIAHRGASGYLPEHTLEAKALAYGMGADYLEQDVVLSKDDCPVVLHDIYLDAVTDVARVFPDRKRADGRYYVVDFTLAELKSLRVTERIQPDTGQALYPHRFPAWKSAFRIPTLSEEIELIQGLNHSTGRAVGIYTELKAPAWHRQQGKDLSRIVLAVLARYGYRDKTDKAFVQCFDAEETRRLRHELGCRLRLVQLLGNSRKSAPEENRSWSAEGLQKIASYADGVGPAHSLVVTGPPGAVHISPLVKTAQQLGLVVHPYTFRAEGLPEYARSFEDLLQLFFEKAEVDGVFTDFPDRTVQVRDQVMRARKGR